jgi:integrase
VFEWAIRRGELDFNPCAGVRKNEESPRDRLVEPHELKSFLEFARKRGGASLKMAVVAELSALSAKALGQLIRLTKAQLQPEGIAFTRRHGGTRKRGRSLLLEWSPRVRELVDELLALPETKSSLYVLANLNGAPYSESGFKTTWNKTMQGWIDAGRPSSEDGKPDRSKPSANAPFHFHDLRAMAITRVKEQGRDAAPLSGHTTERMADRVYDRRRIVRAKPVE